MKLRITFGHIFGAFAHVTDAIKFSELPFFH